MPKLSDPNQGLWSTFNFLTKVRYGGIIGKIAALGIVFLLTLCILGVAVHSVPLLVGGIALLALAGMIFLVLKIESIFKANPEMATLEGTEIIRYRQVELKSKNHDPIRVIELTTDPELPERTQMSLLAEHDEVEGGE